MHTRTYIRVYVCTCVHDILCVCKCVVQTLCRAVKSERSTPSPMCLRDRWNHVREFAQQEYIPTLGKKPLLSLNRLVWSNTSTRTLTTELSSCIWLTGFHLPTKCRLHCVMFVVCTYVRYVMFVLCNLLSFAVCTCLNILVYTSTWMK